MIVRACIAYASIQNVKECSCCTNSNTSYLGYYRPGMFLRLRRAKSAMRSGYFSFENERLFTAVGGHEN